MGHLQFFRVPPPRLGSRQAKATSGGGTTRELIQSHMAVMMRRGSFGAQRIKTADSSKKILVSWATGSKAASANQKTPLTKAEIFREPAAAPRKPKCNFGHKFLAPAAHSRPFLRARRCALCKSVITEKTQRKIRETTCHFHNKNPPTSLPAALAKPRQPRAEGLHEN
jgi:hypothetical protein